MQSLVGSREEEESCVRRKIKQRHHSKLNTPCNSQRRIVQKARRSDRLAIRRHGLDAAVGATEHCIVVLWNDSFSEEFKKTKVVVRRHGKQKTVCLNCRSLFDSRGSNLVACSTLLTCTNDKGFLSGFYCCSSLPLLYMNQADKDSCPDDGKS